jgi:phosphatidylinositol glycan class B
VVIAGIIVDSLFYGQLQVTWWNFIKFNLIQGLSEFYGVHHWHWYLTQGLPMLLTSLLPLVVAGVCCSVWSRCDSSPLERHALPMALVPILMFSQLSHKEYRFLYPLLPVCFIWAGRATHSWAAWAWNQPRPHHRYWFAAAISVIMFTQLFMGAYMGTVHQRGVVDVMQSIANIPGPNSVLYLMPCHSTPWTSHVNRRDMQMRFLTCEPPIARDRIAYAYRDEADLFYQNPVGQLQHQLASRPSIVVAFEELLDRKSSADGTAFGQRLHRLGYKLYKRHFNSHFIDDERRVGDVLIFKYEQQ